MPNSQLSEKLETKYKKPKMYAVIMHNDDYTTMQFVVEVLINIFNKASTEATDLMMQIHTKGSAVVGIYTYDIAVTKKLLADRLAEQKEFPLKITIDEE